MRTVVVLAVENVVPFDLAMPIEVFRRAASPDGGPAYEVRVCAGTPVVEAGLFTINAPWGLEALACADTIIVPGTSDLSSRVPAPVLDALREAAAGGTRIASICVGTFTLAAAGLLDGLRATTHWAAAGELAERHPAIEVDPRVLYVDNGQLLTSAGAAAGLDLCLHLIRRDHGAAVAAAAARMSVIPLEREGGQAQFIDHDRFPVPKGSALDPVLRWMEDNLERDLTLADIAEHSGTSTRTLMRHFREQAGDTPLGWLHRTRVRRAQHLLETTAHSVEQIAARVGFGSPTAFRDRFKRVTGVTPRAYRQSFKHDATTPRGDDRTRKRDRASRSAR